MEFENLQFADEKINKVKALLPAVRASRANIFICGPTGTGKSALAKYLLGLSEYAVLDATDLQEDFDFTAFFAKRSAEICLLENVEKLSASQQKNLFETLQRSNEEDKARIISTSRISLKTLVQKNQFREDLYYRLTVLTLEMPALAERLPDIEILANHLINVFGIIHRKGELAFSAEALEKLKMWSWPGNIRELENVLERAVILAKNSIVEASDIAIENQPGGESSLSFAGMTLSQVEQKLILQTLQLTEQNRTRAAEILGISIRTLRNKINEYRQAGLV